MGMGVSKCINFIFFRPVTGHREALETTSPPSITLEHSGVDAFDAFFDAYPESISPIFSTLIDVFDTRLLGDEEWFTFKEATASMSSEELSSHIVAGSGPGRVVISTTLTETLEVALILFFGSRLK
jgi:hypothetical protein